MFGLFYSVIKSQTVIKWSNFILHNDIYKFIIYFHAIDFLKYFIQWWGVTQFLIFKFHIIIFTQIFHTILPQIPHKVSCGSNIPLKVSYHQTMHLDADPTTSSAVFQRCMWKPSL